MKNVLLLAAAAAAIAALPSLAEAACPARVGVGFGDTPESIARRCGVNVEALRQANPGMRAGAELRQGTSVAVPRPALPSQQLGTGRPMVRIAPPMVQAPVGGGRPTVILPPEPPPMPRQPVFQDFGQQPGQHLPLPGFP